MNNTYAPTNGTAFITEEMWLDDYNTGAWTEVGYYTGQPYSIGALNYFYAYTAPGGQYNIFNVAQVPLPDIGGNTDIKITRNRQPTSNLQVAIVSTYLYTNWSTVIANSQGGTSWAGNNVSIGSEMGFNTPNPPSSAGTVKWIENRWQAYNGGNGQYIYQTSSGNMITYPYQHPAWEPGNDPPNSTTGGIFNDTCCTYP